MFRFLLLALATLLVTAGAVAAVGWVYLHPAVERTNGIVYGKRGDRDLTLDILRPPNPNGLAVAVMISGSWKSKKPGVADALLAAPMLRAGYTAFYVCHVSQPDATVMEIVDDVNRAIRFIRHNAAQFGVDPKRIAVAGGSSGGHLALMLATRGARGPADAPDPIDRESSAVQAVAVFYPVTDLVDLGPSTENLHDGGPPKSFVRAFGPDSKNPEAWKKIAREMSPLYHVTRELPPTLIYHGDADTLVPLEQSQRFQHRAYEVGRKVELMIHPGGKHGWPTMIFDERQFAKWFDAHLRPQGR